MKASTHFYLEKRKKAADDTMPLLLIVSFKGKRSYLTTGHRIKSNQWDNKAERVVAHPLAARINIDINRTKLDVDEMLLSLASTGELARTAPDTLFSRVRCVMDGETYEGVRLLDHLRAFADTQKNPRTRAQYLYTGKRILAFDPSAEAKTIDSITPEWLSRFDAWMEGKGAKSANTRSIHLRNIRAVINNAITLELTSNYPFRRFKVKTQPTRHRALTAEQLRELFNTKVMPHEQRYLDMFKLMFFLCGIAPGDLFTLKEIRHGRITTTRNKTSQPIDIKVEPEAMEIIDRYRGNDWLLNILDNYANYDDFLKKLNRSLKTLGGVHMEERVAKDKKVRVVAVRHKTWPELSAYWARHTWASIARSLDVPMDVIAHALGHSQKSVTDIYVAFDRSKVDKANRMVIDHIMRTA